MWATPILAVTHTPLIYPGKHTQSDGCVRPEPISKSCEITQADNLNRRQRLSRKAQRFK